jgi:hypothetical protein
LYNSKNDSDKELSKRIRSYKRVLANIIDLENVEAGVQKFAFGKKLLEKIMSYKKDPEYQVEGRDFLDPEVGRNFVLIKKTVDNFPGYNDSRPEIKTTALSQIFPNWKSDCHNLVSDIQDKSYDDMMKILADTKHAIIATDPGALPTGRPEVGGETDEFGLPVVDASADLVKDRLSRL